MRKFDLIYEIWWNNLDIIVLANFYFAFLNRFVFNWNFRYSCFKVYDICF